VVLEAHTVVLEVHTVVLEAHLNLCGEDQASKLASPLKADCYNWMGGNPDKGNKVQS